jgi:murein DD-endopeptidase MepM/ murein hydrolase activator NlpD
MSHPHISHPNIRWPLHRNIIRGHVKSNTYGMVRHRADGTPKPHQGWDFEAPVGTPCHAIADGEVVFSSHAGDFGLMLVHSFELNGITRYAAYAHLASTHVTDNKVSRGQVIAKTGKSGNAQTLPPAEMHLHFEIRTMAMPGLGLAGRISPIGIYHVCPLTHAIICHEK